MYMYHICPYIHVCCIAYLSKLSHLLHRIYLPVTVFGILIHFRCMHDGNLIIISMQVLPNTSLLGKTFEYRKCTVIMCVRLTIVDCADFLSHYKHAPSNTENYLLAS